MWPDRPPVPAGATDPGRLARALEELSAVVSPLLVRSETRAQVSKYVQGLLANTEGKSSKDRAEVVGDVFPWRTQRLLNRSRWNADEMREKIGSFAMRRVGDPMGCLVLLRHDVVKCGETVVASTSQITGDRGRRVGQNYQTGLYLAYVSPLGAALIDRELYLPRSWVADRERCVKAGIPEERMTFRSHGEIAKDMLARAMGSGVPFSWVVGGPGFAQYEVLRSWLKERGVSFVMNPPGMTAMGVRQRLRPVAPAEPMPGTGPYGRPTRPLARFPGAPGAPRGEAYAVQAKAQAEALLETACARAGLDRSRVRTWTPWYRHTTLSMLALAVLTNAAAGAAPPPRQSDACAGA
ncbi:IS701 family transposase [Streptomyces yaizuensis]|uniref:IS701 family transposase n=1 Tax=Streptomyces yaizuensis TaxID=2989713 RepID=A0ABQ5P5D0_9ACTN|nr:IS701 family transposase [Streptomyces sp. YSPA8]